MVLNFDLIKFLSKGLTELSYDNHKKYFQERSTRKMILK